MDTTSKGKDKDNREQIQIQYRPVGSDAWQSFGNYSVVGRTQKARRVSYGRDLELGQYDVRVRVAEAEHTMAVARRRISPGPRGQRAARRRQPCRNSCHRPADEGVRPAQWHPG